MNNKGVSLMSLAITIVVMVILAAILFNNSMKSIENGKKAAFVEDLLRAENYLRAYNTTAELKANNRTYYYKELQWDGFSDTATNTARIEDAKKEDTIKYILKDSITSNTAGKLEIISGDLFVKGDLLVENEWIDELAPRFSRKKLSN